MSVIRAQPPIPVSEVVDGDGKDPTGVQDTSFERPVPPGSHSNFDAAASAVGGEVHVAASPSLGVVGAEMGVTPTPATAMLQFTQSPPMGPTSYTQLPTRKTHRKRASAMTLSSDTTSTLPEYQRYQVFGLGGQGLQRRVGVGGGGGGGGDQDEPEEDEESDRPPDYPDSAEEADEDTDEEDSLTGGFGGGAMLSDRKNRFGGPQPHAHEHLGYQRHEHQYPRARTHTPANLDGINAPRLPNSAQLELTQPFYGSSQDQAPDLDLHLKGRSSHATARGTAGGEFDVTTTVLQTTPASTTHIAPSGVGSGSSPRRVKRYQHHLHSHSHSHSIAHTNSTSNSQHHCHHCTHTPYLPQHYPQQQPYQEPYQHYHQQHLPHHLSHLPHLHQPHPYQHSHNLHPHPHPPHRRKAASVSLGGFHSATATTFASSSTSGYPHRLANSSTPPPNTPTNPTFDSYSNSELNLTLGSNPKLAVGLPAGQNSLEGTATGREDDGQDSTDPYLDSLLERSVHALEMSNTLLKSTMKTQSSLSTILAPDYRDDDVDVDNIVDVGAGGSAKRQMKKRSGSTGRSKIRMKSTSSNSSVISGGSSRYKMVDERRAVGYSERIREMVKQRDDSWTDGLEEIRRGVENLFDDDLDGESASNRGFVTGHRLEGSLSSSLPSASMMEEYRFGRIQDDLPSPLDKQSRRSSLELGYSHSRNLSSSTSRSSYSRMTHKSNYSTSSGGSGAALRYSPHRRSTLIAPAPRALTQYVIASTDPNEISLPSTLGLRSTSSSHWAPSPPPELFTTGTSPMPITSILPPTLPTITSTPTTSPYLSRAISSQRHALASASTPNLSMTLNVKRANSPLEPRVTTTTTDSAKSSTTPAIHMLSNLVQRVGVGTVASTSMAAALPKVTLTPPRKQHGIEGATPGLAGMFTPRKVSPEAAKKAISSLGESFNSASSMLVQSFGKLKRASSLNLRGEALGRISEAVGFPAPPSGSSEERGRGRRGRSASVGGVKRIQDGHGKPMLNTLDTSISRRKSPSSTGSHSNPGPSSGVTPSPSSSCSCSRNGTPRQGFTSLPPSSSLPSSFSAFPADFINSANISSSPSQTQTQIYAHHHHHHAHQRTGNSVIAGYRPMTPPIEAEIEDSSLSSSSSDGVRAKLTVVSLRKILDEQPPPVPIGGTRSAGGSVNGDGRKTMKAPSFMPRTPAPLASSGTSTATASISRLFTKGVHSSSTRPPDPPRQSAMKRSFSSSSVGAVSGNTLVAGASSAGASGSGTGTPGSTDSRPMSPTGFGSGLFPLMMGSRSNSESGRSTPKRISFAELPESYASTKPEGSTSKFNDKKNGSRKKRKRGVDGKGKGKATGDESGSDAEGLGWWASLLGGGGSGIGFGLGGSGFVGIEERYSSSGGSRPNNGANTRSWTANAGRMGLDEWAV